MDVLWRLLEEVDKKNMDLLSQIVFLITRVYQNLSFTIDSQIHEIAEQFAEECLTRLSHVILKNDDKDMENGKEAHAEN